MDATGATAGRDVIYGRGGNDLLFGDNIDQNTQSVPGEEGPDVEISCEI
ncbi:hypothetical protein ACFZDJ_36835 [Streptomyces sp. NPDC007896]